MTDKAMMEEFDKHIQAVEDAKAFFDKLYNDNRVTAFYRKPFVSILMDGIDYLIINLKRFKEQTSRLT